MLVLNKSFIELKESRSQRNSWQESSNQRAQEHGYCGSNQAFSYNNQRCPHCLMIGNGGVGGTYELPGDNGYYPNPPLVDIMVIMVPY